MLRINQPDGFDCPGCAWPEPHDTSRFEFCENGAKAVAEEATDRRITAGFFADHSIEDLATRSDYWLGQQGRLTEPMYRSAGATHYRPISWDGAVAVVADRLRSLASPDRAVFYTSGRTSNEAAFLYQLFARAFGTNNLPDCSNMCHESSGVALGETIGIGKGTVTLDDVHAAELIVVAGQNPGTNHPRMLGALEQAKRNGAAIVSINPLPEAGLIAFRNPQRLGGYRGASHRARRPPSPHRRRCRPRPVPMGQPAPRRTGRGRPALRRRQLRGLRRARRPSPVPRRDVACLPPPGSTDRLPSRWSTSSHGTTKIVVCWAMGLTQHRQAVATIREIVNTVLLRGSIGRRGAGLCPVRGHSNVQGDRTMGIVERPSERFLDALAERVRVRPAAAPRLRHGGDDRGDGRRRSRRLRRARRQLRRRSTGHRRHGRRPPAMRPDGAGVDQAEPLARHVR